VFLQWRSSLRNVVTVLVALALTVAACGTDSALDSEQLEADIAEQLLPEFPGAIRSVSCPNDISAVPGQTVLCLATLESDVIDVTVRVGGTEDALTTRASVDVRFVAVNEIAALLAGTFGDETGIATSVDCGQPVVVLEPDDAIICRATDSSGVTRSFDVQLDADGTVSLELR